MATFLRGCSQRPAVAHNRKDTDASAMRKCSPVAVATMMFALVLTSALPAHASPFLDVSAGAMSHAAAAGAGSRKLLAGTCPGTVRLSLLQYYSDTTTFPWTSGYKELARAATYGPYDEKSAGGRFKLCATVPDATGFKADSLVLTVGGKTKSLNASDSNCYEMQDLDFLEGPGEVVAKLMGTFSCSGVDKSVEDSFKFLIQDRCADSAFLYLLNDTGRACVNHGAPTFFYAVTWQDIGLQDRHTLTVSVSNNISGPVANFAILSPAGGVMDKARGAWSLSGIGLTLNEEFDFRRKVNFALRLPAGMEGEFAVAVKITDDANPSCPGATAGGTLPRPYVDPKPLLVVPQKACYDGFIPQGPSFWEKGGKGWRYWDATAGNSGGASPARPVDDVMLCPSSCQRDTNCEGKRPACYSYNMIPDDFYEFDSKRSPLGLDFMLGDYLRGRDPARTVLGQGAPEPRLYSCVIPERIFETAGGPWGVPPWPCDMMQIKLSHARGMISGRNFTDHYNLFIGRLGDINGAAFGLRKEPFPRKRMYRDLIANHLNWLASYAIDPKHRPNLNVMRLAVRWLAWSEAMNFLTEEAGEGHWKRAWEVCPIQALCASRPAALQFLGGLADLYAGVPPDRCGKCIHNLLKYYPTKL